MNRVGSWFQLVSNIEVFDPYCTGQYYSSGCVFGIWFGWADGVGIGLMAAGILDSLVRVGVDHPCVTDKNVQCH